MSTTEQPTTNGSAKVTQLDLVKLVRGDRPPRPEVDTSAPILPEVLRDRRALESTTKMWAKRNSYKARKSLVAVPAMVGLLLWYFPRGVGRLTAQLSRWVYDLDSADMRHQHATSRESNEYARLHAVRRANLHARWMVLATASSLVIAPVLAWTFPHVLSGIAGAVVFWWVVKLIPGKSIWEYFVAAGIGVATWYFLPMALVLLPRPPFWGVVAFLGVLVLAVGWVGRPQDKKLVKETDFARAGIVEKPTADMILEALCRLGISSLTPAKIDEVKRETRVIAPGVARSRRGYHLQLELPWAVTASEVMEKREALAAALKRDLGTVWPSQGPRHPGHLCMFLSDLPMATSPQPKWPLAAGKPVDIFESQPMFTDQEGRWVDLQIAYKRIVIAGSSGTGKSFYTRQIGIAAAFDPRVRIVVFDGKANGDLDPLQPIAHGFYVGADDDEIEEQLAALKAIEKEMLRRNRFLRELPREINPESKVTSALVDMYPDLAPYLILIDELQEYTQHEDKTVSGEFKRIFTRFARLGRSGAIIPVFCTQKPDSGVLPTSISGNCSTQFCLKVNDSTHVDQVLGTSSHKNGLRPNLFSSSDYGMSWHKGDGQDPLVVRSVHGLDGPASDELVAKAYAIRKARGLLTGAAAGEEPEEDRHQVEFLADVLLAFSNLGNPASAHLADLVAALAELQPSLYGHADTAGIGGMLRGAGVAVKNVWDGSKPEGKQSQKGVKLDWVQKAAADSVVFDDAGDALTEDDETA